MEGVTRSKSFVMPLSDIVKLLRIPFSVFLLPVFLFGLITSDQVIWQNFVILFILLHFFIYPASNAYNSYMDQDKGSIGGLERPPAAGIETYYISIALDLIALTVAGFSSLTLMSLLIVYSVISRLYSWKKTRLKRYPWASLVVVSLIQGGYTYMVCSMFFTDTMNISWFQENEHFYGMLATTLMVAAIYPLTQIYQHNQDLENGDRTVSYVVGIKGTFILSGVFFTTAMMAIYKYFNSINKPELYGIVVVFVIPSVIYFLAWAKRSFKNYREANFRNTMMMNKITATLLISAFLLTWYLM